MISIRLGNPGSGKTAVAVREMMLNDNNRLTFTNIATKIKTCRMIEPSMIVTKEKVGEKKKKDGTIEAVYDTKLNVEFWKDIKEPINVVLDEAHTIMNARRSMSKKNVIVGDWLALIRRVLGQAESGYGELVLISQLHNRIDIIAREMATNVRYHVCHYTKSCKKCGLGWSESSETPEPTWRCPGCHWHHLLKHHYHIEIWHFATMQAYIGWKEFGMQTYHSHYIIEDIEKYFNLYNTMQWENLFTEDY